MIFDWIDEHKKLSVLTFIIIVLGFPLLVNQLSVWEAKCDVFGYPSDWLSFWGTYLAAIASFGMIIISAISIHRNSLENKANRDLQYNVIKYQNQQSWILQLKEAICRSCITLGFSINDNFIEKSNASLNAKYGDIISTAFEAANESKFLLYTVLIGHKAPEEISFIEKLDFFTTRYFEFLFDLQFFFSLGLNISSEKLKEEVEKYKSQKQLNVKASHRIWAIIESKDYSIGTKSFSYYLNTLIKEYHFEEYENACVNLIHFEESLANKILDVTKQDK